MGGLKDERLSHIIVEKHISKYCFFLSEASFEDPKLSVVDTIVIKLQLHSLELSLVEFSFNQSDASSKWCSYESV